MRTHLFSTALLAACFLVGCAPTTTDGKIVQKTTLPSTTAEVARKDLVGYTFFDGKIFAPAGVQSDVMAPYELPIEKVYVSVGQRVGKGAPLVKLTMPGTKESLAMAESNRDSARAAYNAALSGQGDRVASAQAALKDARSAEAAAKQDVMNGGTSDVESATQIRVDAERELAAAQAERSNNTWAERQALAIADEYLSDARSGANQGILRAPISGVVTKIEAKVGMKSAARQLLVTIVDTSKVQVQAVVPPEHSDEAKAGSKVLIALEGANSDPFEGTIRDVTVLPPSEGQASAGYLAVISFDNTKGKVLPGMQVKRIGLRVGSVEDALVVPLGALAKNDAGQMVTYVKNGDQWVEKNVETGLSDGALVQIKSGVKEGDVVQVKEITVAM